MTDFAPTHASEPAPPASRPKLVDILSQDVTPQVDAAAKALIAGGDALLVKTSRTAVHGFILDQEHYDTRLEWTALNGSGGQGAGGAGGGGELQAICSCETRAAGFVCPHLWATVLLADRSGAFRALEEAHMHPIFHRNGEIADAGTEKKRRSPNAWPARPGWKIHLASIAQAAQRRAVVHPPTAAGLPRQAIYVVDAT